MLITKFNKLIRNRLVWAVVAILVSVSFILSASVGKGCKADERQRGMGELFGEDVSRQQFLAARFFEMGMRDRGSLPAEAEEALRKSTWVRLAMLHAAQDMGLTASDEEVAEAIQRDPTFAAENGAFSKEKYRSIVEGQLRIPLTTFDAFVRQDLTLRKLNAVAESMMWVPPSDLRRRLANLTDKMKVEYGFLPVDASAPPPEVAEDEARSFYDDHAELFRVPDKLRVRYVRFPVSNYLASVEVDDDDIQRYYDDHLEDYMTVDTNNASVAVPLDDVRGGIVSNLIQQAATFKAKDEATDFVIALAPDRYGNVKQMNQAAADAHLMIQTTAYFSAFEDVPDLNVGYPFKEAAFKLDARDPNGYFSDAVIDQDAVYVVATDDKQDAHLPDFSNIVDRVMVLAVSNAAKRAFLDDLGEIREQLVAAGTNTTFSRLLSARGATVVTSSVFTIYEGMASNEQEYAELLIPNLITLGPGEISEPIEAEGGALMARLIERSPGEMGLVEYLKPQLMQTLNRYWSGAVFNQWGQFVLDGGNFRDFTARAAEEGSDEPEEEE